MTAATVATAFFDGAERLVIETLAAERVDFERFDAVLPHWSSELAPIAASPPLVLDPAAAAILTDSPQAWQLPLGRRRPTSPALRAVAVACTSRPVPAAGDVVDRRSAVVEPSCLIVKGLPVRTFYPALLDGSWATAPLALGAGAMSQDDAALSTCSWTRPGR